MIKLLSILCIFNLLSASEQKPRLKPPKSKPVDIPVNSKRRHRLTPEEEKEILERLKQSMIKIIVIEDDKNKKDEEQKK